MAMKKLDNRIRTLIDNSIANQHRSVFLLVGDKATDQIAVLYNIFVNAQVKTRPTVLWCYKNELSFNKNKKKRMDRLQKRIKQGVNIQTNNIFDIFVETSNIRFVYYKNVISVLGNTYGMLVLQDFEALTPNILARTIETIEGGGIVVFLLSSIDNLRQLYTLSMDVHMRYRTESHQEVSGRFNERFLLSLSDCRNFLVLDDKLNVLPIFSAFSTIEAIQNVNETSQQQNELSQIFESFYDVYPIESLLKSCKTVDQAKVLCKIFDIISGDNIHKVVSLTSSRGRGKSAVLGLFVSGVVAIGYSNIYVTAPCLENLLIFFKFVLTGLMNIGFEEKTDYEVSYSTIENHKYVTMIKINKKHRQIIKYVTPEQLHTVQFADLVICDECAAIPLPYVKNVLKSNFAILSSTINGYEGTGRSLSLKLIKELREKTVNMEYSSNLVEVTLDTPIRYSENDPVERWLNLLLCLDNNNVPVVDSSLLSSANQCQLFYVSRDTLFSYHKLSEHFLQLITNIFVASHYKNSPNDLQLMADAPAHHIFVLLPDQPVPKDKLPQVLCVIQVCYEGGISQQSVEGCNQRGQRAHGDLIPWTVAQQFGESSFASLTGVRIVRIATHPNYTSMGYGSRAMQLLIDYFLESNEKNLFEEEKEEISVVDKIESAEKDEIKPRSVLPPLFVGLRDKAAKKVDYLGVSYGLTDRLLKFWKKLHFIPVYLRQTPNLLTGEFTNIMIRPIHVISDENQWLHTYYRDFRSRLVSLLAYSFRDVTPGLILSLMFHSDVEIPYKSNVCLMIELSESEIDYLFTGHDLKRLESYSNNLVDYHFVMDLVPPITKLLLNGRIEANNNNWFQLSVFVALGLQFKDVDQIQRDLNIPKPQILSTFNKTMRKVVSHLYEIKHEAISNQIYRNREKLECENENGANVHVAVK